MNTSRYIYCSIEIQKYIWYIHFFFFFIANHFVITFNLRAVLLKIEGDNTFFPNFYSREIIASLAFSEFRSTFHTDEHKEEKIIIPYQVLQILMLYRVIPAWCWHFFLQIFPIFLSIQSILFVFYQVFRTWRIIFVLFLLLCKNSIWIN